MRSTPGLIVVAMFVAALATPSFAKTFSVGDKVRYYAPGWYDATVVEIGTGEKAGSYLVKPDAYARAVWSSSVEARPRAIAAAALAAPPRTGDYLIRSYGNPANPLHLGRISLLGGQKYRFYDNGGTLLGEGRYGFAGGRVSWSSGILQSYGWGGEFKIRPDGREHSIKLNRTTFAINAQ